MMAGVGCKRGAYRGDARGSDPSPNSRYDITCVAEGADRVINVATEGVERGWNVERFTSGREYLSILLGVGYLYTSGKCMCRGNN